MLMYGNYNNTSLGPISAGIFFAPFASADQNSCLVVLLHATFVIDIFTALGVGSAYIYIAASLRK